MEMPYYEDGQDVAALFKNPYENRFPTPLVPGLLVRGDEALGSDDWSSAESCYVSAYFVNGGRGPVIKSKIELVKQIRHLISAVTHVETRIETARFSNRTLKVVLGELHDNSFLLDNLRSELPQSAHLGEIQDSLNRSIRRAERLMR